MRHFQWLTSIHREITQENSGYSNLVGRKKTDSLLKTICDQLTLFLFLSCSIIYELISIVITCYYLMQVLKFERKFQPVKFLSWPLLSYFT